MKTHGVFLHPVSLRDLMDEICRQIYEYRESDPILHRTVLANRSVGNINNATHHASRL